MDLNRPSPKINLVTAPRRSSTLNQRNGFTLVEVLLGIVILALISLTLYALMNFTLKVIWESKAKITATALANQKIEMARNLSYQDVGTIGGIPAGIIPATETITRNNIEYTVTTDVLYVDDPFDGTLGGEPNDTLNTDYKRVRVAVSWDYRLQHKPIVLITDIAPPGLESAVGGGTLKILVYDALGLPVPQATVTITNSQVNPTINIQTQTDNQGYLILPGSPVSTEGYQVMVTKSGYSTAETHEATAELPSPEKPHASVFEGQTTSISFAIDQLSNLNLKLQNENEIGLSGVSLNIRGEKTLGFDAEGDPVYKYNQNKISSTLGQIILNEIEWDTYHFTLPETSVYNISNTTPPQPLNLLPNTTIDVTLTLVPKAEHSVLVLVKDVNSTPLTGAQVHLYNYSLGLDQTLTTDEAGQTYFTPWQEATSSLEVIKEGFENYTDELEVSSYYIENVVLTQP